MDNTASEHNNLFANPALSRLQSSVYQEYAGKRCSGRECTRNAVNLLEILFINKRGYFCDECTSDLLAKELAVKVLEGDQS